MDTVEHLAIQCAQQLKTQIISDVVLCYSGKHCRSIIFTETKQEANDIYLNSQIKPDCQVPYSLGLARRHPAEAA